MVLIALLPTLALTSALIAPTVHHLGSCNQPVVHSRVPFAHTMVERNDDDGEDDSEPPWWRRPPPTWPPRVDDPTLILGDIIAAYSAAFVALDVLTVGRGDAWQSEGAALASSWIIAAAVTNAWCPTAVLPSLGVRNAVACVLRSAVDLCSTRLVLALAAAFATKSVVDVKLLVLELSLEVVGIMLWRAGYLATSTDTR